MPKNLWEETKDEEGNSSIQLHELRPVSTGCKPDEHYFEFIGGAKREARCKNCTIVTPFILGIHQIKDGKISRM